MIQEVDLAFQKIMKLEWIDLKRKALQELTTIHEHWVSGLVAIQTPESLLAPIRSKISEMKLAAGSLDQSAYSFKASSLDPLLLAPEVKNNLPASLWEEWKSSVQAGKRDYLLHLIGLIDGMQIRIPGMPNLLRGLVLTLNGTPTEAFALIESAPESTMKTTIAQSFERRAK
jgi:hypothetical protein